MDHARWMDVEIIARLVTEARLFERLHPWLIHCRNVGTVIISWFTEPRRRDVTHQGASCELPLGGDVHELEIALANGFEVELLLELLALDAHDHAGAAVQARLGQRPHQLALNAEL